MDDGKQIFTQVIKKQMEILGAGITLARVRNVPGIKIDQAGNVVSIEGNTQVLLEQLTNQFVELSGLIIKKTMESILSSRPIYMPTAPSAPSPVDTGLLAASHDIEELNKVLATLNTK